MNETLKTIAARYSCRAYTGEPVAKAHIEAIAKAGLQAPSAMNKQPWHIVAVTDKALVDELNEEALACLKKLEDKAMFERIQERGGKVFYNAPAMFLILKKTDGGSYTTNDCGIVQQNMALAATSLGLGNVIVGMAGIPFAQSEKAAELKAQFKWPEGYEFGMGLLVGHAVKDISPHEVDESKLTVI
ncbi:MAG: nitroreductase [Turicibacter sp.]|nr:nitroreductase [Turicibacter sp.]